MIAERLLNQNSLIVIAIECIIVLLLLIMALIRHRKIVAGLSQLGIEEAVSRESSVWLRNALIFLILATIEIFLELFFIVPISMLAALIISILVLWITAMWILYEELMPYFVRLFILLPSMCSPMETERREEASRTPTTSSTTSTPWNMRYFRCKET